jgi:hypothetical protein
MPGRHPSRLLRNDASQASRGGDGAEVDLLVYLDGDGLGEAPGGGAPEGEPPGGEALDGDALDGDALGKALAGDDPLGEAAGDDDAPGLEDAPGEADPSGDPMPSVEAIVSQ